VRQDPAPRQAFWYALHHATCIGASVTCHGCIGLFHVLSRDRMRCDRDFLAYKAGPNRLFRVSFTNTANERPEQGQQMEAHFQWNEGTHQKAILIVPHTLEQHIGRGANKFLHISFSWPGYTYVSSCHHVRVCVCTSNDGCQSNNSGGWLPISGSPRPFKFETRAQVEERQQIRRRWRPIGVGHYGTTYACHSIFSGEEFALKEVPFKGEWNAAMAEIQPFLALNYCDCICKLREFRIDDPSKKILLFFTYCKGGNLEEYLTTQRRQARNSVLREVDIPSYYSCCYVPSLSS
jgi:hypothetical protein